MTGDLVVGTDPVGADDRVGLAVERRRRIHVHLPLVDPLFRQALQVLLRQMSVTHQAGGDPDSRHYRLALGTTIGRNVVLGVFRVVRGVALSFAPQGGVDHAVPVVGASTQDVTIVHVAVVIPRYVC